MEKNKEIWISEEWERRRAIQHELSQKKEEYDIETSHIFDELREHWKNYDRDFLRSKVMGAIMDVHRSHDLITHFNDGSEYNRGKIEGVLKWMQTKKDETDNDFPLEWEYIGGRFNGEFYTVAMDECCIVNKADGGFDILFAVQYSMTPIKNCDDFLTHHLKKSFDSNLEKFGDFMENICLEYKKFLSAKHEPFFRRFIEKLKPKRKESRAKVVTAAPNLKLNWQGQSNSLTYLFRQLKTQTNSKGEPLISNSYEEIAEFLKNNFNCYESVKIATIGGQLKKSAKPKKARKVEFFV